MKQLGILCIFTLMQFACGYTEAVSQRKSAPSTQIQQPVIIDRETAVRIAKDDAIKTFGALEKYDIVVCDQSKFWRVFFEPTNLQEPKKIFEYVVDKRGGFILARDELSLNAVVQKQVASDEARAINETDAIKIAARDARTAYGSLRNYRLTVCELKAAWRIIYAPQKRFNGGGPEYLIDKSSGQILDKKYYQ